jgi:OmpA-OmpF porin, OOP family
MRFIGLVLIVLTSTVSVTSAAEPFDLNIQNFRPAMDARSLITVERSRVLGTFEPSIGLYMNYAWRPLKQKIGDKEEALVEHLIAGKFLLSLGFFNVVQVGGALPISIVRADGDGPGDEPLLAGDGIGDAEAHIKVRVVDGEKYPVGLALAASIGFGVGQANAFVSHGQTVVLIPSLILDWQVGQFVAMSLNLGAHLRETRSLDGEVSIDEGGPMASRLTRADPIRFGNSASYGFGVAWSVAPESTDLVFETFGSVPLIGDAERAMPVEVLLGVKLFLLGNSFFTLGASRGLLAQYGDPDIRGFAGIVFEPTDGDRDRDGITDDEDRCPSRPEDIDQYEDSDGCPDPDNDRDQIPDIIDQCPDVPEDRNQYEDHDGCPEGDRDRDRDGLSDVKDKCPNEPEDRDNFRDEDGCPEPDNDLDGVLDTRDRCPLIAEDIDGFEDSDGCPDKDNDKDGVPDTTDRCPDQAENLDGVDDEDGCPEAKVVVTRDKIEINEKVYFETDKAVIKSGSHGILDAVASTLQKFKVIDRLEIQGHTDSRGDDAYNLDLSHRRAEAVRAYLIESGGITATRLSSKGYGETRPLDSSETRTAWSKNRRVEFIIVKDNAGAGAGE